MTLTTFAEDRHNVTRWEMHHAWARDARTIMQSYDDDTPHSIGLIRKYLHLSLVS